jgi:hypothetical protein
LRPFTLCLALSLVLPFTSDPVVAQTDSIPPNLAWANLGLGGMLGTGSEGSPFLGLDIAYQRRIHLLSIRGFWVGDARGSGEGTGLSVLYGRVRQGTHYHAALSIGPSFVNCRKAHACSEENKTGVGIGFSGQAFWTSLRYLGLGLYVFGDLNSAEPLYGAMVALRLGRFR